MLKVFVSFVFIHCNFVSPKVLFSFQSSRFGPHLGGFWRHFGSIFGHVREQVAASWRERPRLMPLNSYILDSARRLGSILIPILELWGDDFGLRRAPKSPPSSNGPNTFKEKAARVSPCATTSNSIGVRVLCTSIIDIPVTCRGQGGGGQGGRGEREERHYRMDSKLS